ncbi:CPBP family intramembrane metalloprotease [Tenacibaculum sp. 190130A14a]|uniref:CPBP family intramembrane metalloprotease n=1 Tax=Tenacibaculum polynesiense TaxID=3137857 RepID=A0ABM9PDF0_9FLAO
MNTTINSATERQTNFNKAKKYTLWVLGLSWGLGFLFLNLFNFSNLIFRSAFSLIYGFLPAIIAFIINRKEGRNWTSLRFIKPSLRTCILAILIPIIYVIVGFYCQIELGYRSSPNWAILGSPMEIALVIGLGFLATSVLVMGEEIGWRGYLQEKLFKAFGEIKGVIILGIIWGFWHLPVALKGYNFPDHPYMEAFITYPLACTAFSLIIAYLGFQKYSIFIAILFHGANNHFNAIALSVSELNNEFGFAMLSNFICIDLILIFGFLFWRKLKNKQQA